MDKLKMMSFDNVQENIKKIQQLFPNAVTEVLRDGKPTLAVDFDVLKQEMSSVLIDDKEERYQFTWPDKKKSILLANTPISATLRPCKEESVDFDNTQNLYIEGDNLDVLKLLQETYLGKIKMIYIDPPYNTGSDFIYDDDFAMSNEEWDEVSGYYDEQGNRLVKNLDSNGRFHTDWLNMIYPRLKVAKDLLSDDGVIFISIDDNEIENLLKVIKEIFAEDNLINTITVKTNETKGLKNAYVNKGFPKNKEYLVIIAKNIDLLNFNSEKIKKSNDELKKYVKYYNKYIENIDAPYSEWIIKDFTLLTKGLSEEEVLKIKDEYKEKLIYFVSPDNVDERKIPQECNRFYKIINNKGVTVFYYRDATGKINTTLFLSNNYYKNLGDLWVDISTININKEVIDMPTYTNGQKPVKLLERIIKYMLSEKQDGIVLDFFSGSATTADAVMKLNSEDNGNRKFIMVQLQENLDENIKKQAPDQQKSTQKIIDFLDSINKPHYIPEYAKERIRRAGKKIKQENPDADIDVGFRVLKLDSSNMKDVYYKPADFSQNFLDRFEDNIKEDRTPFDLLFQVMLELGKPLSARIEEKVIAGKNVFIVDENDLIACFDKNITDEVVISIAKMEPLYAVFRDYSFANDSLAINFDQIFEIYSPNTKRRTI